ncbi:Transcription factor IIIB 70 kDa subunit-like protein [Elsinoe fawcettii]|nr:Transcription factor IIIB 70 kDa subunit-like protein [Elsinoe fawcettii]
MPPPAPSLTKPRPSVRRLGRNKTFTGIPASPPPTQPPPQPAAIESTDKCCESPKHEILDGCLVCLNCGTQLSENNIVAEVTFGESSTGRAEVQGGYISQDARHANTLGSQANRRLGGSTRETREETKENGRNELRQMCIQLNINRQIEDMANVIWGLASANNFIQGRRTNEVAAACLYAACRREENNTVMLMDIAETQTVNVFSLGDIYKEMTKVLYLRQSHNVKVLMEIEPLIMKYCQRLEFGDKTREVAADAARIIRRMKRDWMVTGRHPAGLCGACIILAARMNNFRRTVREVVYIVKVSNITINSRLQEFKNTRSSTMSVQDFRVNGLRLKYAHDPPSVNAANIRQNRLEAHLKKRMARLEQRNTEDISDTTSSASRAPSEAASDTAEVGDTATQATTEIPAPASTEQAAASDAVSLPSLVVPAKRKRNSTRTNDTISQQQNAPLPTPESSQAQPTVSESSPSTTSQSPPAQDTRRDADGFVIPALPSSQSQLDSTTAPKKRGRKPQPIIRFTEADFASENELEYDIKSILQDADCVSARDDAEREKLNARAAQTAQEQRSIASQIVTDRLLAQGRTTSHISDSEIISPDEFDDDPEVANALLDEDAVKVKEAIWLRDNEDWLRAQQAKALRQELEKAEGRADKKKKKRKRSKMGDGTVLEGSPVTSPADATARMLNKRAPPAFSKNIDYEALNRIYDGVKAGRDEREGSVVSSTASEVSTATGRSRASSVTSSVVGKKRVQIGEASWVEEREEDVSLGKAMSRKEEKAALKRVRQASGEEVGKRKKRRTSSSAGSTGRRGSATPTPDHEVEELANSVEEPVQEPVVPTTETSQQDGELNRPIEIADNGGEEDEDDEDDEVEEEAYDSDNAWGNQSGGEDDYGDVEPGEDDFAADVDGDEDVYGTGMF